MKYFNHILSYSLTHFVLTITNGIMFTSAIDKHHGEGRRRRRNTTVNPSPRSVPNADRKLRRITVKSGKDHSRQLVRNKRTRGANDNKKFKQSRRELGKSSGSGKSNGGSSGGSNGSSGGGSGGGGSGGGGGGGSGSGWSSDGYYCGCLCLSSSDMNAGSYLDGVSCDFTVHENNYGTNNNRIRYE